MDALVPLASHPAVGEIRGGLGLAAAVDVDAELLSAGTGAMGRFTQAIRDAGVLLRVQSTGVAIGPPLTVEPAQLREIASAIHAGLDAAADG
jgi:putrescine aminotransferase